MRRILVIVATALCFAAQAGVAAAAQPPISIRQVDADDFPNVSVTVSTAEPTELTEEDFLVRENGVSVGSLDVESLMEAGETVEVVLVIDTSGSMQGKPLASAIAAATEFVESVPDNIRVGVVSFSDRPRVAHPITSDRNAVLKVLKRLSATGETALYDAVDRAAALFAGDAQRNLIVLSDGADSSSRAGLRNAVTGAKKADAAVFSVGLKSGEFDVRALRRLARLSGGTYAPAAAVNLGAVYDDLASRLSHQYVLTYRSDASGNSQISMSVGAEEGTDTALFLTPAVLQPPAAPDTADEPTGRGLVLTGPVGLAVALGALFLAVFLVLAMVLGSRARARRERELVRRIAATPQAPSSGENSEDVTAWIPQSFVGVGERVTQAVGFTEQLDAKLERAGLRVKVGEFVGGTALVSLVATVTGLALFQSAVAALLLGAVAAATPPLLLSMSMKRRARKLQSQLPDILSVLASSLRSGHSFMQALDMVGKEIGRPGSEEFSRMVAEIRLGRPAEEAMHATAQRIGSEDFDWAVLAVNIQREVGGNLAEILDTVAETIRERETIRRQVQVLSAEGRMSIIILAGLPFVIGLYIAVVNPSYISVLFTTRIGLFMLITGSSLLVAGIAWMRKVVKIDV